MSSIISSLVSVDGHCARLEAGMFALNTDAKPAPSNLSLIASKAMPWGVFIKMPSTTLFFNGSQTLPICSIVLTH